VAGENYVTRDELNSSLNRISADVRETNKIIREQNSQFAVLIAQEVVKREAWCESHDEDHKSLAQGLKSHTSTITWRVVSIASGLVVGSLLTLLAYLLARH